MYYVYVLKGLRDKKLYIGITENIERRIDQHNQGMNKATKYQQWELIYFEAYKSKLDASNREYKLKCGGQQKRWLKERLKHSLN